MPLIQIPRYEGYCTDCGKHTISHSVARGDTGITGRQFNVLKCTYCGGVRFLLEQKETDHGDPWYTELACYPAQPFVQRPFWLNRLNNEIQNIMNSVYCALDHHLFFLASIGVRTAIDRLICEKIGDVGTFEKKINELKSRGYVDQSHDAILSTLIDAGSASAHRGFDPSPDAAKKIIELAERIIHRLAIDQADVESLVEKAGELKREIPKKPKSNKS